MQGRPLLLIYWGGQAPPAEFLGIAIAPPPPTPVPSPPYSYIRNVITYSVKCVVSWMCTSQCCISVCHMSRWISLDPGGTVMLTASDSQNVLTQLSHSGKCVVSWPIKCQYPRFCSWDPFSMFQICWHSCRLGVNMLLRMWDMSKVPLLC